MKTTQAVHLLLTPENAGWIRFHLTGMVRGESRHRRRKLLGLTSRWSDAAPLRVALSADGSGSWSWTESWTDALSGLPGRFEVRFVARGGGRGRR